MTYFTYSTHKSRAAAEEALNSYFAEGIVSESEKPRIVCRMHKMPWHVEFTY